MIVDNMQAIMHATRVRVMLWEAMDYSPSSHQSMVASATWSLVAVVLMEETVRSASDYRRME
jgi:hypothetical protein